MYSDLHYWNFLREPLRNGSQLLNTLLADCHRIAIRL
jgi:hypothetical protein